MTSSPFSVDLASGDQVESRSLAEWSDQAASDDVSIEGVTSPRRGSLTSTTSATSSGSMASSGSLASFGDGTNFVCIDEASSGTTVNGMVLVGKIFQYMEPIIYYGEDGLQNWTPPPPSLSRGMETFCPPPPHSIMSNTKGTPSPPPPVKTTPKLFVPPFSVASPLFFVGVKLYLSPLPSYSPPPPHSCSLIHV